MQPLSTKDVKKMQNWYNMDAGHQIQLFKIIQTSLWDAIQHPEYEKLPNDLN